MNEPITLRVYEVVGSSLCVASEDGEKVFKQIELALGDSQKIRLSFENVENLTSAFLNAAIGQLYGVFSQELLKESLSVENIEKDDLLLLKRVIDTAKNYFQNPDVIHSAWQETMGNDNE